MTELQVILSFLRDERKTLVERMTGSVLPQEDYAKLVGRINQIDRTAERVIALEVVDSEDDSSEAGPPAPATRKGRVKPHSTPRSWP